MLELQPARLEGLGGHRPRSRAPVERPLRGPAEGFAGHAEALRVSEFARDERASVLLPDRLAPIVGRITGGRSALPPVDANREIVAIFLRLRRLPQIGPMEWT